MVRGLHDVPRCVRRLVGFVAASFALHALTLVGIAPGGVSGAPYRGAATHEPLRATLAAHPAAARGAATPPNASAVEQPPPPAYERAGTPGGVDLPLSEKWYAAEELDVLATPIGEVHLDYPEELEGSGMAGRVQLRLFIDERGVVRRMQVVEAEPKRFFDRAAMRAWKDVRFSPAQKAGTAVKSQKLLELAFTPS
jgi:TonB family protein